MSNYNRRRVVPTDFMTSSQSPQNCAFDNYCDPSKTTRSGGNENLTQPCACNFGQRSQWDEAMYLRYYDNISNLPTSTEQEGGVL